MYKRGLFSDWVPKHVQLILIIVLTIPLLTVNGIYSSNINDMMSGMGILSEDLMMANYAASIGMGVVLPLVMKLKQRFKSRHLLLSSFSVLALLGYICANTDNVSVLVGANFLMGIFKLVGMVELILPIMFMISPTGDRAKFYSVFYPISIGSGMLSSYFTAQMAYDLNWQHVYDFALPFMLLCILLIIVFTHNYYGSKPVPIYQYDWLSMVLFSVSLTLLDYVLCYGKMMNWFASPSIQQALAFSAALALVFIWRQLKLKRPYLPLHVFKRKNVITSIILFILMGAFTASGSIQSAFTSGILKYNSITNAEINLYTIAGALLGAFISFAGFKKNLGVKPLIFTGFLSYVIYHVMMYFLFSLVIELRYLILPTILKGMGLVMLYIAVGVYAAEKLTATDMLSSSSMVIMVRSFIGPGLWGAVYSYYLYAGQLRHTSAIVQNMDSNDPLFISRYSPTLQGAIAQGQSVEAAQSLATQSMWGAVQLQATLAASKEIFGWIILGGVVLLIFIMLFHFNKINLRPWVRLRTTMRRREILKDEEEMLPAMVP